MNQVFVSKRLNDYACIMPKVDWTLYLKNKFTKGNAAILIPLLIKDGELQVLLTKRSYNLRSHPGEVCFPGGKFEESVDCSLLDTALRESKEEVGLTSDAVTVICEMIPTLSKHNLLVQPYVGFIPDDFCPTVNEEEVHSVFYLPLSRFLQDERHTCRTYKRFGEDTDSYFHTFTDNIGSNEYVTWGLTGNLLIYLAIIIFEKEPAFQVQPNIQNNLPDPLTRERAFILNLLQSHL